MDREKNNDNISNHYDFNKSNNSNQKKHDNNNNNDDDDNNNYNSIDQQIQNFLDCKIDDNEITVSATTLLCGIFRKILTNIIQKASSG